MRNAVHRIFYLLVRNIILVIGDGMSLDTVASARKIPVFAVFVVFVNKLFYITIYLSQTFLTFIYLSIFYTAPIDDSSLFSYCFCFSCCCFCYFCCCCCFCCSKLLLSAFFVLFFSSAFLVRFIFIFLFYIFFLLLFFCLLFLFLLYMLLLIFLSLRLML